MDTAHSTQTGELVRREAQIIAHDVVELLYGENPSLYEQYGSRGKSKCREDTAMHLLVLADALDAESVDVFRNYVVWSRSVMKNYGVEDAHTLRSFELIPQAVEQRAPDAYEACATMVSQALADTRIEAAGVHCEIDRTQPHAELAERYLKALLNSDRAYAIGLIADAHLSLRDVFLHVLTPALREIGNLWQRGAISVDQEHYCTQATRDFISLLGMNVVRPASKNLTVVGAGVAQELHEIGLRMVCDLFEYEGWRSIYLGANTPMQAILTALDREHADVLAMSATSPFYVHRVSDIIQRVRRLNTGTLILVGGHAFNAVPELWRKVKADGYAADAQTAVHLATELLRK